MMKQAGDSKYKRTNHTQGKEDDEGRVYGSLKGM
jgi:hypothetical protein